MKPEVHKLRVNVKSLAAEAKIIREEIRRAETTEARQALHDHRMVRVRPEARLAHLALAFMKGRPYKMAESTARSEPVIADLVKKITRFACVSNAEQKITEWLHA
jgi:hypothetical protein